MRRRLIRVAGLVLLTAALLPLRTMAAPASYDVTRGWINSFDGTPIVYNYFVPKTVTATNPAPLIMRTHGWGGSGETTAAAGGTLAKLLDAGYTAVTWDSRGFGQSGGEANIDDPLIEGRDASALLTAIAARPEVLKRNGDPVVGMTGGSYAGGIQLALASIDPRIDAIAPEITWNDLNRALWPGDVIKLGWGEALYGAGLATATAGGLDPRATAGIQTGAYATFIHQGEAEGLAFGVPQPGTKETFGRKGLSGYGSPTQTVRIPTLLLQGKTDTLFDLNEAWANYQTVVANGAPAKLIAFCGGHAGCPSYNQDGSSARGHLDDAVLTWFDKFLKGNAAVDTGAPVEWSLSNGTWKSGQTFPTVAVPGGATIVTAAGEGSVVNPGPSNPGEAEGLAVAVTDSSTAGQPDTMAIPVIASALVDTQLVGIGRVAGSITGTGSGTNLIFKLVDRTDRRVVDWQAATLRVDGPFVAGTRVAFSIDLVGVAELLPAGHALDLEVATTGAAHATYRGAGSYTVTLNSIQVPTLPLA